MAQREGHLALTMAIHILLFDLHLGAVSQDPFNHSRNLRGRTALKLGVDTDRFFLYMPVDHHPSATIADVPFGHEILIPRAELFGIRGPPRCPPAPNLWASDRKGGIGDVADGFTQRVFVKISPSNVEEVMIVQKQVTSDDAFETGGGA